MLRVLGCSPSFDYCFFLVFTQSRTLFRSLQDDAKPHNGHCCNNRKKNRTKNAHKHTLFSSNPDVDPSAASSLTIMALESACPSSNQHHSAHTASMCARREAHRHHQQKQSWEGNFRCNNNFLPGVRTVDEDKKE